MTWNQKMLNAIEPKAMEPGEMDKILGNEEELVPTSGFLMAVMERVREEATAPAPLAFPWKIAVPGMILATAVLGWGGFVLVRTALPALRGLSISAGQMPVRLAGALQSAGWVALALAISLVSSWFSRRLAGGSGLL